MSTEKKISFSGEDGGINRLMDDYKKKAESIYSKMKADADQLNISLEKQVEYLSSAIDKLEEQNRLTNTRMSRQGYKDYSLEMYNAKNEEQRQDARQGYETSSSEISKGKNEDKNVAEILRQIVKELENDEFEDEARTGGSKKGGIIAGGVSSNGECCDILEKYLKQIAHNTGGSGGKSAAEDKRQERQDRENAKKEKQQQDKKQESLFGSLLTSQAVSSVFSKVSQMGNAKDENSMVGKMFGLGVQAGVTAPLAALAAIVGLTPTGAGPVAMAAAVKTGELAGDMSGVGKDRELAERLARDKAANKLRALTGISAESDFSEFGLSKVESAELMSQMALSSKTRKSAHDKSYAMLGVEKGFSVDRGLLLEGENTSRYTNANNINNVAAIYTALRRRGLMKDDDFSKFTEEIKISNQYIKGKSNVLETVDSKMAANMQAQFRTIGGGWADDRLSSRLDQLDKMLSNPSNDYQKSSSFSVLSQLHPDMTYFQMLEEQSKGMLSEGYLSGMMKQKTSEVGGGESLMTYLTSQMGLSPEVSRSFVSAWEKNPSAWDKWGGTKEQLSAEMGYDEEFKKRVEGASGEFVTTVEKSTAVIANAFLKSWHDGILESFEYSGKKLSSELKTLIDDIFNEEKGNIH